MVRLRIKGGVKWPVGFDLDLFQTPGRHSIGSHGRIMRLARKGCANRPFFHLEVTKEKFPRWNKKIPPIEQVGTYDPMVNMYGEKLVSLNIERINYYLAQGVKVHPDVGMLLGLAGLLPQQTRTYMLAWRNRLELEYQQDIAKESPEEENKSNS